MSVKFETYIDEDRREVHIAERTFSSDGTFLGQSEIILKIREQVIRESLIALGWTPPPEDRSNEDASTQNGKVEIDRGGVATAWGDLG